MKQIKCVVWDLDNTIWNGILSEDANVTLNSTAKKMIELFDARGILQSISSKNNYQDAMDKLVEFGLDQYFLYPQISWDAKSKSIQNIQKSLNIGMDTFAFIDDQDFEREEVSYHLPDVSCFSEKQIPELADMDMFHPIHLTSDSKNRRQLYMNDIKRNEFKEQFSGTEEDFLNTLQLKFEISHVREGDLARAEELTVRTHQLNATGYTYSYEELERFSNDPNYSVLIASLKDKFGDYGKIGLVLLEKKPKVWRLKLLLMSCRVMSRGVGSVFLRYIAQKAKEANVDLLADFVPTNRNRIMYITYKFSGFEKDHEEDSVEVLKMDKSFEHKIPDYVELIEGE